MAELTQWLISIVTFALALGLAHAAHALAYRALARLAKGEDLFWRAIVTRSRRPTRLAAYLSALVIALGLAPLTRVQAALLGHVFVVAVIVLATWLAIVAVHVFTTLHLRRFKLDTEDNLLARKHVTQSRILERTAQILVVVLGTAAALMTFEGVRQYGVSLLASAGVAGIVLGLALQPLLKNLVGGIQLAVTQPIRLDDAVIVEGEWGQIEEITATYVVVRLWDLRRMVLPLSWFMENPFQNWTRESASLIGSVILHVDYTAPVAALRAKLAEIAAASEHWDGNVVGLQVTDFTERTMELRMLVSARNAGAAFNLRCEVREKIVAYLNAEHPQALPRTRAEISREISREDVPRTRAQMSGAGIAREG